MTFGCRHFPSLVYEHILAELKSAKLQEHRNHTGKCVCAHIFGCAYYTLFIFPFGYFALFLVLHLSVRLFFPLLWFSQCPQFIHVHRSFRQREFLAPFFLLLRSPPRPPHSPTPFPPNRFFRHLLLPSRSMTPSRPLFVHLLALNRCG